MIDTDIIRDAADLYGITIQDITSPCRKRRMADARAVVCYLLHSCIGLSSPEIGRMLKRTHATVLYFNRRADDWVRTPRLNPRGAAAIKELRQRYSNKL
jgi:chromosomal replication initiation ATPase DnaA